MLSPLILFTYNRPSHTLKTLEALQRNTVAKQTRLFIYSDAPLPEDEQAVNEVRALIKIVSGFADITIVERSSHLGLARSVIQGVSEVLELYPRAIVFEDDLVCSDFTLEYFNQALTLYQSDMQVGSVTAYTSGILPGLSVRYIPESTLWLLGLGYMENSLGKGELGYTRFR